MSDTEYIVAGEFVFVPVSILSTDDDTSVVLKEDHSSLIVCSLTSAVSQGIPPSSGRGVGM